MEKKIVIIDEAGFARVCSALLEREGHRVDIYALPDEACPPTMLRGYDLLITSFPYGATLLGNVWRRESAAIVLSDCIDSELFAALEGVNNCFCMIKPIDYDRFRFLVNHLVTSQDQGNGGYQIV